MKVYTPRYYHDFQCIAAACPDSCCKDWAVDVDPKAAAYYRSLQSYLGDRLRSVLKDENGSTVMAITEGRCPMWRKDGLCEIQAQLGHEALCRTCREFPRLRHDYGDFMELGLELSCPEAARLILSAESFVFPKHKTGLHTNDAYDNRLMSVLLDSRQTVLDFLENSIYPMPDILAVVLLYAHAVQAQIDGGDEAVFDPESCLDDAMRYSQSGDMGALFSFFEGLEILTPQWKQRLSHGPVCADWHGPYRALVCYFVQRYWLQAVSDYDLICRVKFMIAGCLLICGLGGDPVQTAQQFSKEIENDPDNMDAILDGAYTSPALTDLNLLSLLKQWRLET